MPEIIGIVQAARQTGRCIRPVGSGYSYTPLVQTDDEIISLDAFSGVERIDLGAGIAVVGAGTRLDILVNELALQGAALANLGDIDRQTVAGAIATGTHGTGIGIGSLSDQVVGLSLVSGRGEILELDAESAPELFPSAQISLGALGIVTSVKLKIEPHYSLRIERGADRFESLLANLDRYARENRNFEFFWFPRDGLAYTKRMNYAEAGKSGQSTILSSALRFANDVLVENFVVWVACETTLRHPKLRSRWMALARRLVPNDTNVAAAERCYATPRLVRHFEIEYAVPMSRAADALAMLDDTLRFHPVKTVIPIEVRFAKAEQMPLSVSQGSEIVYVAVHTYHREDYLELFDLCEDIFIRFGGRPHWGKMHSRKATDLEALYTRWQEFQSARKHLDPDDIFVNGYLRRILGLPYHSKNHAV